MRNRILLGKGAVWKICSRILASNAVYSSIISATIATSIILSCFCFLFSVFTFHSQGYRFSSLRRPFNEHLKYNAQGQRFMWIRHTVWVLVSGVGFFLVSSGALPRRPHSTRLSRTFMCAWAAGVTRDIATMWQLQLSLGGPLAFLNPYPLHLFVILFSLFYDDTA